MSQNKKMIIFSIIGIASVIAIISAGFMETCIPARNLEVPCGGDPTDEPICGIQLYPTHCKSYWDIVFQNKQEVKILTECEAHFANFQMLIEIERDLFNENRHENEDFKKYGLFWSYPECVNIDGNGRTCFEFKDEKEAYDFVEKNYCTQKYLNGRWVEK